MKALSRLLILFLSLVLQSCLPDPVAPSNEPNPPTISFGPEMPSRLFIQLSGSYTPRPDIVEYGFEIAENAFSGTADTLIINPPKDSETSFSCTLQLKPGMKYVFRSYLASTLRKKYSQEITRQMPTTSAALLSEVSFQKGRLTAVLLDDPIYKEFDNEMEKFLYILQLISILKFYHFFLYNVLQSYFLHIQTNRLFY